VRTKHKAGDVTTTRVSAILTWTLGSEPTAEERKIIGATCSAAVNTCTFRCPCCDEAIGVVGRDMGIGAEWIPAIQVWERLRSGETLRPK
jgi:hypothetical protein